MALYSPRREDTGGHREVTDFWEKHGAKSPFEVVPGPLLNSGTVIRRPIYQ